MGAAACGGAAAVPHKLVRCGEGDAIRLLRPPPAAPVPAATISIPVQRPRPGHNAFSPDHVTPERLPMGGDGKGRGGGRGRSGRGRGRSQSNGGKSGGKGKGGKGKGKGKSKGGGKGQSGKGGGRSQTVQAAEMSSVNRRMWNDENKRKLGDLYRDSIECRDQPLSVSQRRLRVRLGGTPDEPPSRKEVIDIVSMTVLRDERCYIRWEQGVPGLPPNMAEAIKVLNDQFNTGVKMALEELR